MKFGPMAVAAGEGAILAHGVRAPGVHFRKGEVLDASHIAALKQAGITNVMAAKLEPGDVGEDAGAAQIAAKVGAASVRAERPFTGRCNLLSRTSGLVLVDSATIDAINAIDEAITVATLAPMQPVVAGEIIATVKIIPFAVPGTDLERVLQAAKVPAVAIAAYRPLRVGVVSTLLPGLKAAIVSKTLRILEARLAPAGASIVCESRVPHDTGLLAETLRGMEAVDLIVLFGATAITDRRDVLPAAIERAGGRIEHFGMPVDPGNLLLLGRLVQGGEPVPVVGAPGCARSVKENGFDFVLRRFLAGIAVGSTDLRGMGVGGLLSEIVTRPQLRQIDG